MEIKFKPVHTAMDLVISSIILAVGIGLFFVNMGLGVVIAACALLMLLFYKSGYMKAGDNVVLKKQSVEVSHQCRESLKGFLDGKDVDPKVDPAGNGGIIRVEIYYNADKALAYAQLFDFSCYAYEPATEIVELRGPRAGKLMSKLNLK